MKLLLFSDLHCDRRAAESLASRAPEFDVLIGAGDFASIRRGINICLDILSAVTKPVVLVPGNNETFDELVAATRKFPAAHVLHGTSATIKGIAFFGIGGGVPVTPFGDWSFDFSEKDAGALLAPCPAKAVLVSHSPPFGVVDVASSGKHLGSTAVKAAVVSKKPQLVVCGHIHHSAGKHEMLSGSVVVNAGPAGMEWTL